MNDSGERVPLTARGEIANEDSGGRYSRHVVWERRYSGSNWSGTIAYVDSIFGDGSRLRIPAYILTCPKDVGLTCFSLEFERNDLTSEEVDEIPNLIHGIFLANSPMKWVSFIFFGDPIIFVNRNDWWVGEFIVFLNLLFF